VANSKVYDKREHLSHTQKLIRSQLKGVGETAIIILLLLYHFAAQLHYLQSFTVIWDY